MEIPIKKLTKKADVKKEFDEDEDIEVCNFSEGEPVLEGTLLRSFNLITQLFCKSLFFYLKSH